MQSPAHASITATELAHNLSNVIDRLQHSRQSVYITDGSHIVAELSPAPQTGYPINRLSDFLNTLSLPNEQSELLKEDIEQIKNDANLPETLWDYTTNP